MVRPTVSRQIISDLEDSEGLCKAIELSWKSFDLPKLVPFGLQDSVSDHGGDSDRTTTSGILAKSENSRSPRS